MSESSGVRTLRLPSSEVAEVIVLAPDGSEARTPTFLAADGDRRVRFRAPATGTYTVLDLARDHLGGVEVVSTQAATPQVRRDGRHLTTQSGAPFLWLADTWWYALSGRLRLEELDELAHRRRAEGFNAVQIVAGLVPEVYGFDDLGALDGVWPWTPGYGDIEPRWWDAADERIRLIVDAGLVPVIVGAWSYYLLDAGRERMERHWREIIARWSAYPVVWCIAGEVGLARYEQVGTPEEDYLIGHLAAEWAKVLTFVQRVDGYANLRTIHPYPTRGRYSSADYLDDTSALDIDWLQTGHGDRAAIAPTLGALDRAVAADHALPVINSEVCYEGIAAGSDATLQRFLFWSHMLAGAAGHSYGAQGLWAFRRARDSGPGLPWGDATWQEAAQLAGGTQLGASATMLRDVDWQSLRPSPSSLSVHASPEDRCQPYAARSADLVVAYFPAASLLPLSSNMGENWADVHLQGLESGTWTLTWWNPRSGSVLEERTTEVGPDGHGALGSVRGYMAVPSMEDWVLLARRTR